MPSYDPGDGRRLYYDDTGLPASGGTAARTIVLLHGWACHAGYFAPQTDALAARYRLVAPDLRGHRRSHRPGDTLTLGDLAGDLRALLDHLALPAPPVIVGWSMGALVAFEFAARFGTGGLSGLAVVDMTPRVVNDSGWPHGLLGGYGAEQAARAPEMMRRDWAQWVDGFLPSVFAAGKTPDAAVLARVRGEMMACDPAAMASLWQAITAADYRTAVAGIDVPALILCGAESRLYGPGTADWLAAAMPLAEVATIERAGHAPHLERPSAFNRLLAGFVERLGRQPPRPECMI